MDWDRVEGNWKQVKGRLKEKWGQLTEDDLNVIDGRLGPARRKVTGAIRLGEGPSPQGRR